MSGTKELEPCLLWPIPTRQAQPQSLQDYWGLFLAKGIAVSVLGLAAIIVPLAGRC